MLTDDTLDLRSLPVRDRILWTAHDLFYREGIRATGIDRVIAEAGVTKVTFYRQFPSKNDLILAFLALRHDRWMTWFKDALVRHGSERKGVQALVPALAEWLGHADFRGCAFINSVGELGGTLPAVVEMARRHKQDVADVVAGLLPPGRLRARNARALVLAMDGAIVQAQFQAESGEVLKGLECLVTALVA
ncbi:TetR/AcrR family transcriptional regulator [Ideonella sp.]|uniref:TetR/AcrR family transcriptional regulator n=1 Tax=Ideonella sp. TaxID=1929293 RepID=UPI0035B382FC